MPDLQTRLRRFVEDRLPWYSATEEQKRDRHTEAVRLKSIAIRKRAEHTERVITEYREAEHKSDAAGEALIEEARRDDL